MATKSVLKSIVIKDKRVSSSLIGALENAEKKQTCEVRFSKSVRTADDEMIKKLFGDKK